MTNSMRTYKAIEIQKISVSTQEERYLLSCNGSYYEVNYPIVELVKTLQDYPNETEAISPDGNADCQLKIQMGMGSLALSFDP